MGHLIAVSICLGLLLPSSSFALDLTPIVNIQGVGSVQGSINYTAWTNRTINQFMGIPYAQSPVGTLRFQPPVTRTPWTCTLNVSQPGVRCPQAYDGYNNLWNEDCLTLSVYSNDLMASRPVLVWIHGGYFFYGGASKFSPIYLMESDIVLVVIQYRLGPLGFLSLLNDKIPGNAGVLDAIMALEWVQQHIQHLGGNPREVTVDGHSAGASIVSSMLHSPMVNTRAVPLFKRAILQSGSIFSTFAMCDAPVEGSMDIAGKAGCTDPATVEQCLQQVPVVNLLQAFNLHIRETIVKKGYPMVSGACIVAGGPSGLLPQHPINYLDNAPKNVNIMTGSVSQEGLFLLNILFLVQPESIPSNFTSYEFLKFLSMLQTKFGYTKLDGAMAGYYGMMNFLKSEIDQAQWKDLVPGVIDICGNHGIKGPVLMETNAISAVNPDHVYLYSFDFYSNRPKAPYTFPFPYKDEVDHTEDLNYLFPLASLNDRESKMAKTMVQLWTSFAVNGAPSAVDVPTWPPAKQRFGPYIKINEQSKQAGYYLDEFRATAEKYRKIRQGLSITPKLHVSKKVNSIDSAVFN